MEETKRTERSDLEVFSFWLKDLAGRSDCQLLTLTLDRTGHDCMACDATRSYDSKAKCQRAAEGRVAKAYEESTRQMKSRFSRGADNNVCSSYMQNFDAALEHLRELLQPLRTPATAALVDEISRYLVASGVHEKARKLSDTLEASCCLDGLKHYTAMICYDTYDPSEFEEPGLFKLVAKAFQRYGFDILEVLHAMERDAVARMRAVQNDFNCRMHEVVLADIVEPVQQLLPQLQDVLAREAA